MQTDDGHSTSVAKLQSQMWFYRNQNIRTNFVGDLERHVDVLRLKFSIWILGNILYCLLTQLEEAKKKNSFLKLSNELFNRRHHIRRQDDIKLLYIASGTTVNQITHRFYSNQIQFGCFSLRAAPRCSVCHWLITLAGPDATESFRVINFRA